ncbi:MAG: hypothetical protein DRO96_03140 [Candidatus Aenigmatarchaeota archaeon]|nr:MAG: hypothetical protein B6U68_01425 [Candidatus Aenigmarchaeota archaeon ex4484_14]RLI96444.1 MAG: hypothetical protein DRO96_03140 [Candidatus Aenigmarchaeota archaeon]
MASVKNQRGASNTLKAGIVTAVMGALIQASKIADKFPEPLNFIGYMIVFCSVIIMAWDLIIRRR